MLRIDGVVIPEDTGVVRIDGHEVDVVRVDGVVVWQKQGGQPPSDWSEWRYNNRSDEWVVKLGQPQNGTTIEWNNDGAFTISNRGDDTITTFTVIQGSLTSYIGYTFERGQLMFTDGNGAKHYQIRRKKT